ncbi:HNH endonuclease family protein [Streptomyces acidicola]|uniref:HNH endonuclease n=1 Tax=Streptomyces acidicola TaxID=2596892 RepID=A0A5N8WIN8_9ACTN|nr:HNH endonuclease family protein [Streptomyces acidicola]MPY47099.1 HNH endonuclease [Streptomyces acidicola]MPY47238.1 HNH endonuclease [Streptomyces acidicola]
MAAAIAALLFPATAHAAPADIPPRAAAGETITLPVSDALNQLPVRDEDRTGYTRDKFKHWIDADKDGCNTRAEVLKAEAVVAPTQGSNCALTGGEWYSAYDNLYLDTARKLDVDHRVPLAEAWDSGASAWGPAERQAFANDLDDPRALIAVSAASNRSKADKDPADWLPPYTPDRCEYVTDWITIKTRYALNIDPAEQAALNRELSFCPDQTITVTLAR